MEGCEDRQKPSIFTRSKRNRVPVAPPRGHDHVMNEIPVLGGHLSNGDAGDQEMILGDSARLDQSGDGGLLVLDSCHSTWVFDVPERRFRRVLKGLDIDPALAATDWRPYERLELSEGSEAFVVVLNSSGTRRIRSWRHVDGCVQCDGEQTVELSLEDLRRLTTA